MEIFNQTRKSLGITTSWIRDKGSANQTSKAGSILLSIPPYISFRTTYGLDYNLVWLAQASRWELQPTPEILKLPLISPEIRVQRIIWPSQLNCLSQWLKPKQTHWLVWFSLAKPCGNWAIVGAIVLLFGHWDLVHPSVKVGLRW